MPNQGRWKRCTKCERMLPIDEFSKKRNQCKACVSIRTKQWRFEVKMLAFAAYGGAKCVWCGEDELAFLCIDHVNEDGAAHRKKTGGSGTLTYSWLRKHKYPPGYQVLCHNCNHLKSRPDPGMSNYAQQRRRVRSAALKAYGGQCVCCGEDDQRVLTFDHVNGGGKEHKRKLGNNASLLVWARDSGYPPALRLLCHNCNLGRSVNGGTCPHQIGVGEGDIA